MRVGFAGTPEFAVRALAAIHAAGHTIPVVLTQPDRPSGRGLALAASPVRRHADTLGLSIQQPRTLKDAASRAALEAIDVDVLVVAAYGLILPRAVLDWPAHGCLNIHASLLPRWRGAAPIARAIEAGDATTGITIMQMDEGLDTGAMVQSRSIDIGPRETAGSLHDRLALLGAATIVDVLAALARDGHLESRPQPEAGVTYAAKLGRVDAAIDWNAPAMAIDRKIRAMSPSPGAAATWQRRCGQAVGRPGAGPDRGPRPRRRRVRPGQHCRRRPRRDRRRLRACPRTGPAARRRGPARRRSPDVGGGVRRRASDHARLALRSGGRMTALGGRSGRSGRFPGR